MITVMYCYLILQEDEDDEDYEICTDDSEYPTKNFWNSQ